MNRGSKQVIAGLFGAALLVTAIQALPSTAAPTVMIRGTLADPHTFSLTNLQDSDDRALVEVTRARVHDVCMAEKGLSEVPKDDDAAIAAYNKASFGDDLGAADSPPDPRSVEIAEGVIVEVSTTWTPESCRWKTDAFFGVDPLVRKGLLYKMMDLLYQGDQAAQADLSDVASQWGECLGDADASAQDLLNVIDDADRNPYGGLAAECLSEGIVSDATRIRAKHHIAVTDSNEEIVAAWVRLIDQETKVARAAN